MTIKPKLTLAQPTHVWACEACATQQPGPEWPGYVPHCPRCGAPLSKAPITRNEQ
jgi:hypothetical protein